MSANIKSYDLDNPFFSVIVPIYNKGPYIERAVNSILNQEYQNFEIIIVCDPSTDNSNEVVAQLTDPRIRVFHRDKPGPGGYAARNLGIKEAKAEWVAFLDADDEWYPEHLYKMYKLTLKYPDARFMTSGRVTENDGALTTDSFISSIIGNDGIISFKEYITLCLQNKRAVNSNSATIHKSWSSNNIWFPEGRANRSGDLYLWAKVAAVTRKIVWSSHIGSVSYRDIVGVSKLSCPSIILNYDLIEEIKPILDKKELVLLKRYANRLIRTAWFEKRKFNISVKSLYKYLYFKNDGVFCFFWGSVALLPLSMINTLRKLKSSVGAPKR